ncbi:hypothetical protein AVEN_213685-1 [Araneus ventricosus]|uniref:RNase H type-1 domain-containing protein n=1 Tax=Araneus ventricosus TaxID=182803 RepID=A0A4Y2S4X6_ARAVE|nr:hypothetical protein AVEN_213685-1 [Araneus ventricosus]
MSLQNNSNIEVGWVEAHIGIAGNEAKKATKEGPKFEIPAPERTQETTQNRLISEMAPTSHHPGPWRLFNSPLAMDPFPASLKCSIYITQIVVFVGKWTTLCTLLLAAR